MDAHLTEEERQMGNRRNGKMQKQVQTSLGEVTVSTPRDRNSSFDPQFIKKRETILAEGVADRIIGLYALGNSTREISDWMEENLGNRVSADTISAITDRVLPEIKAWKSRMLDSVYPIVWMDAIHYKVTDERGCAVTRAIYNVLGIDREGHKELLGMYISRNEGANFWLSVLTDLQNRGVEDILIACIDGLKGFPEAIQSVYPNTAVQLCVVHQIRNSIKYVGSKNQKEFLKDLKCVYQAVNKESAENELLKLEEKWGISTVTITGGKWKAAGQGGELTDEERQYFQERINTLHQIFKADVGRHMGLTADPQLWGEAQLLLAQPARELGLVTDIVRDRDAAIRKLAVEAQMTREELAAQSPELVDALLAEGRLKAEAENKANMDKAAADAVAGALAVVKAVAGDETASRVETTLNTLQATGMSAEQIATVAPLLAKAEAPVHENAEAKSRADILAGLQAAHRQPAAAAPGTVPTATTKSPLLADAERRAEVAK